MALPAPPWGALTTPVYYFVPGRPRLLSPLKTIPFPMQLVYPFDTLQLPRSPSRLPPPSLRPILINRLLSNEVLSSDRQPCSPIGFQIEFNNSLSPPPLPPRVFRALHPPPSIVPNPSWGSAPTNNTIPCDAEMLPSKSTIFPAGHVLRTACRLPHALRCVNNGFLGRWHVSELLRAPQRPLHCALETGVYRGLEVSHLQAPNFTRLLWGGH